MKKESEDIQNFNKVENKSNRILSEKFGLKINILF